MNIVGEMIGTTMPRLEALSKATGRAQYTDESCFPACCSERLSAARTVMRAFFPTTYRRHLPCPA